MHNGSRGGVVVVQSRKATGRAGFKPIWPISSSRAPHQRGPRAQSTHQSKFTPSVEAACV